MACEGDRHRRAAAAIANGLTAGADFEDAATVLRRLLRHYERAWLAAACLAALPRDAREVLAEGMLQDLRAGIQRSQLPDREAVSRPGALFYRLEQEKQRLDPGLGNAIDVHHYCSLSSDAAANCSKNVTPARSMQANISRNAPLLPPFAAAFSVRFGGSAAAYECPKHIADTQALIWRVSALVEGQEERMPPDMLRLVNALIDDARMLLGAARRDHEEPQGPFDHARAFAKADAALGHARAAEVLCTRHLGPRR